jgi:hypothetical protein
MFNALCTPEFEGATAPFPWPTPQSPQGTNKVGRAREFFHWFNEKAPRDEPTSLGAENRPPAHLNEVQAQGLYALLRAGGLQ